VSRKEGRNEGLSSLRGLRSSCHVILDQLDSAQHGALVDWQLAGHEEGRREAAEVSIVFPLALFVKRAL
jgi:hypothetical protein